MSISKTTVTGPILDPNGQPLPNAKIRFTLSGVGQNDATLTLVVNKPLETPMDPMTGDFSLPLWVNSTDAQGTSYLVEVVAQKAASRATYSIGKIFVPNVGPVSIQSLLADVPAPIPTTAEVVAALASLSASADAAATAAAESANDAASAVDDVEDLRDETAGIVATALANTVQTNEAEQTISGKLTLDAGTSGTALAVANGNIIDVNRVVFNDEANVASEGVAFLKSSTAVRNAVNQFDVADLDVFRVYKSRPLLNNRAILMARPARQKILLMADAQPDANPDGANPQGIDQVARWEAIVDNMIEKHWDADWGIFAGDLVDKGHPRASEEASNAAAWYSFDDMLTTLARLRCGVANIMATTGNHGVDYRPISEHPNGNSYTEYLNRFPRQFYHQIRGNSLYIFMGDMFEGVSGSIPNFVFDWWEKLVLAHQGMNVFVTTHQSLPNTIDNASASGDAVIVNGARFVDAMTRANNPAKVDMWFSGHHGTHHLTDANERDVVTHNGCRFVNCGMHIPGISEDELTDIRPCFYRVMEQTDGSTDVQISSWRDDTGNEETAHAITHTLRRPIELASVMSFDGRYQFDGKFSIHDDTQETVLNTFVLPLAAADAFGNLTEQVPATVWGYKARLRDNHAMNLSQGWGTGYCAMVPGGTTEASAGDPDGLGINSEGWAGGIRWNTVNSSDVDWAAHFTISASTSGLGEDSDVDVLRGHPDGSTSSAAGIRGHYKSGWTALAAANYVTLTHGLGTIDLEKVYFQVRDDATGHIFDVRPTHADNYGIEVRYLDDNNIEICAANTGIHRSDNNSASASQVALVSGSFRIMLRKVPADISAI